LTYITKAGVAKSLRVHVSAERQLRPTKTLCGILLEPAQEDFTACDCQRCLAITASRVRPKQRAIKRLNGRRVSPAQIGLIS
jgi:hypothetical protein